MKSSSTTVLLRPFCVNNFKRKDQSPFSVITSLSLQWDRVVQEIHIFTYKMWHLGCRRKSRIMLVRYNTKHALVPEILFDRKLGNSIKKQTNESSFVFFCLCFDIFWTFFYRANSFLKITIKGTWTTARLCWFLFVQFNQISFIFWTSLLLAWRLKLYKL